MSLITQRFHNQHITSPGLATPTDMVQLLCAVQSQDYPGAKWSVGQRVQNGTDAGVEHAFNRGDFLRTHVLRPTWHFVLPADIRWMLQLTAPHVHRANSYQYRELELDEAVFTRCRALMTRALRDGNHLTRSEVSEVLGRAGIAATSQRLAYIMMNAELEGLVCSGARKGKQQTYALLEERAAPAATRTREEALAELAFRFFVGHAPATLKHFAWWSNLTVADAKRGLEAVRQRLDHYVIDGTEWCGLVNASPRSLKLTAHLIPEYDESLTGSKDFGAIDLPATKKRWKDMFLRPVIIGGLRAGTWKRAIGKREAVLELNLFATLDGKQSRALDKEVARYGEYLGMPVSIHL